MGQAQINVRTRACSRTSIARTRPAALTHNVRGKELIEVQKTDCLILFCGDNTLVYEVITENGALY